VGGEDNMIVNVCYNDEDDELDEADIVDLPYDTVEEIEGAQKAFFGWMFDKSNNHKYWVNEEGLAYCSYGTEAFIEWINERSSVKAMILESGVKNVDASRPCIYF
jgi:hypothetical protein